MASPPGINRTVVLATVANRGVPAARSILGKARLYASPPIEGQPATVRRSRLNRAPLRITSEHLLCTVQPFVGQCSE